MGKADIDWININYDLFFLFLTDIIRKFYYVYCSYFAEKSHKIMINYNICTITYLHLVS